MKRYVIAAIMAASFGYSGCEVVRGCEDDSSSEAAVARHRSGWAAAFFATIAVAVMVVVKRIEEDGE